MHFVRKGVETFWAREPLLATFRGAAGGAAKGILPSRHSAGGNLKETRRFVSYGSEGRPLSASRLYPGRRGIGQRARARAHTRARARGGVPTVGPLFQRLQYFYL